MKNVLLVLSQLPSFEPQIIHVDEVRTIERHGSGARVMTKTGPLFVDETPGEILAQYNCQFEAIMEGSPLWREERQCEACAAKEEATVALQDQANQWASNLTLRDLKPKLNGREFNVLKRMYDLCGFVAAGDQPYQNPEEFPLIPILSKTQEDWSYCRNASLKTASKILQAISELKNEQEASAC